MFKNLLDLTYHRNTKEAFGFYIAYLLFIMILGGLLSGLAASILRMFDGYRVGVFVGVLIAVITSAGLAFLVLKEKKLLKNRKYIMLVIAAGILGLLFGGILGLIPAAYFTTRKS